MLALSADVYMARAAAAAMQQGGSGDAGGVLIAEGLYRKSFSVLVRKDTLWLASWARWCSSENHLPECLLSA